MSRQERYLIFTRREGDTLEVWRMTRDKAESNFRTVTEGGGLRETTPSGLMNEFRPAFIAIAKELSNFDTVLGESR